MERKTRPNQIGFTLLEMLFGLFLMALVLSSGLPIAQRYLHQVDIRAAAYEQSAASNALLSFMSANNINLSGILAGNTGLTVPCGTVNCANPLAPTPAELVAAGFTSVPTMARLGGTYQFQIGYTPSTTNIEGRISRSQPLTVPGSTVVSGDDMTTFTRFASSYSPALANAVGYATTANPSVITGPQGQWTRPNPSNTAGIVMTIVQYNTSAWAAYCQQGGNCNMNAMTSNNLTSTSGTITTLNSTNATLNSVSGQTLTYANGTITAISGSTANIPSITGNLNGNATTSNSSSYATTAGSVPCNGITGSNVNLCNGVSAN